MNNQMKTFDPTKPCQTRDGRSVRILCTDAKFETARSGSYPICALVQYGSLEEVHFYTIEGEHVWRSSSGHDLINIPQKITLDGFLVLFPNRSAVHWADYADAKHFSKGAIAVLNLLNYKIEFREGEGL